MRSYLDFLRKPYAARLLGGTLLGRLPNGMGPLAIVLFARAHGGGYTLAGVLSAVYGLAMVAGTLVVTTSRPSRAWTGEPGGGHWAGPLRSSGMRVLIVALTCVGVSLGVISVAAVAYADARHASYASGLLLTLMSAGALIGG